MKDSLLYSTFILTLVCLIAASLLGLAYNATAAQIEEQQIAYLHNNLNQIFPEADDFLHQEDYYIAMKNRETIGFVATVVSPGYSSFLTILVGMDLDKNIAGMRVLEHAETPGLGAEAVKPKFYQQFSNKKEISKNTIDAITGATITTDAVIEAVQDISKKLEGLVENE